MPQLFELALALTGCLVAAPLAKSVEQVLQTASGSRLPSVKRSQASLDYEK